MIASTLFLAVLFLLLRCSESFTAFYYSSSSKTQHQQRRYTIFNNIAEPSSENNYGYDNNHEKNKKSQQELLLDLEHKFDYEGRISSKIIELNNDDAADSETVLSAAADQDDTSSLVEHRCALLTILG